MRFRAIPARAQITQGCGETRRQPVGEREVKFSSQSKRSPASQWQIVARYVESLESINFLKVAQTIAAFISINKILIDEILNAPVDAGPDAVCNQRIRRGLILVSDHGQDVHQIRLSPSLVRYELSESNHLAFEECSDENARF